MWLVSEATGWTEKQKHCTLQHDFFLIGDHNAVFPFFGHSHVSLKKMFLANVPFLDTAADSEDWQETWGVEGEDMQQSGNQSREVSVTGHTSQTVGIHFWNKSSDIGIRWLKVVSVSFKHKLSSHNNRWRQEEKGTKKPLPGSLVNRWWHGETSISWW